MVEKDEAIVKVDELVCPGRETLKKLPPYLAGGFRGSQNMIRSMFVIESPSTRLAQAMRDDVLLCRMRAGH